MEGYRYYCHKQMVTSSIPGGGSDTEIPFWYGLYHLSINGFIRNSPGDGIKSFSYFYIVFFVAFLTKM